MLIERIILWVRYEVKMVECAAKGELNFEDCVSREYCHRFEAHYIVLIIRCRQTLLAIIRGFYVTRPSPPPPWKWKYTFPDVQNVKTNCWNAVLCIFGDFHFKREIIAFPFFTVKRIYLRALECTQIHVERLRQFSATLRSCAGIWLRVQPCQQLHFRLD